MRTKVDIEDKIEHRYEELQDAAKSFSDEMEASEWVELIGSLMFASLKHNIDFGENAEPHKSFSIRTANVDEIYFSLRLMVFMTKVCQSQAAIDGYKRELKELEP